MAACGWAFVGVVAWCSEKAATTLWWQECGCLWETPEVEGCPLGHLRTF